MTQTLGQIFSLALGVCGSNLTVASSDERSREAAICRLWYPLVRDHVQTVAPWPAVKSAKRLARLDETSVPWVDDSVEPGFQFAYAAPSDMLVPYHLQSYGRFAFSRVNGEPCLSCNEETPILIYNRRVEDPGEWDHSLTMATIYSLAVHIARQVTGRSSTIGENIQMAQSIVNEVLTASANGHSERLETVPDYMTARGFSSVPQQRFYYPMQDLNLGAVS